VVSGGGGRERVDVENDNSERHAPAPAGVDSISLPMLENESINLLGVISERQRASWAARSLVRRRRRQRSEMDLFTLFFQRLYREL
jgi:hypothetical protein